MSEVKNGSTDGIGAVNPLRPTISQLLEFKLRALRLPNRHSFEWC
jgi:hypothetical protein